MYIFISYEYVFHFNLSENDTKINNERSVLRLEVDWGQVSVALFDKKGPHT